MPVPDWDFFPEPFVEMFKGFRAPNVGWDMIGKQNMFIEAVLPGATMRKFTDAEMNFYRAPYLEEAARKPLWRWPNEIPIAGEPENITETVIAFNQALQVWDIPKLHIHVTPGAINPNSAVQWAQQNLSNLKSVSIGEGLHYIQEDHPHEIGTEIAAWAQSL